MDEKTKTTKEQKKDKRRNFLSQMWTIILGTTISLIVTIVAAQIDCHHCCGTNSRKESSGQRPSPLCHDGNEQHRKLCTDT